MSVKHTKSVLDSRMVFLMMIHDAVKQVCPYGEEAIKKDEAV